MAKKTTPDISEREQNIFKALDVSNSNQVQSKFRQTSDQVQKKSDQV